MVEENNTNAEIEKAVKSQLKAVEELGKAAKEEAEKEVKVDIMDAIRLVSPGTPLGTAIDDIMRARTGALIVIWNNELAGLIEGGFKVNERFTPQKLMELCKMDGAVVLSSDLKKILYANVLLINDASIPTSETGTRHKAAERTAKKAKTLVIAISERRNKITLYYYDLRYVLKNTGEVMSRAIETLQILEKQREIYDELLKNLNVLEVTNLVSISDVCSIIQRMEMIMKISDIMNRNIIELGKEGVIVKIRMRELTKNIEKEKLLIFKDYVGKANKVKNNLSSLNFDSLLDTENLAKLLFSKQQEEQISPKGYRFLSKTSLNEAEIKALVDGFKNLDNMFNAQLEEFSKVLKEEELVKGFQKELSTLKEQIMLGKKI